MTPRGRGRAQKTIDLVKHAHEILAEIQPTSVRSLCYQLFVRRLIPSMATCETNKVSRLLRIARESDEIPWAWVVDETREAECVDAWKDTAAFLQTVSRVYRRDRWTDQPFRVEVWSEKGTVRGTLAPVLDHYGVTFRVQHGFGSATSLHDAALDSVADDRPLIVLYAGDWDPSGLAMSKRDIPDRIDRYGGVIDLRRIAITEEDLTGLPSFSAHDKRRDPRYRWFVNSYGTTCVELDALSPTVLRDRVEQAIRPLIDAARWERADRVETAEKDSIRSILATWPGKIEQASKYSEGSRG